MKHFLFTTRAGLIFQVVLTAGVTISSGYIAWLAIIAQPLAAVVSLSYLLLFTVYRRSYFSGASEKVIGREKCLEELLNEEHHEL